MLSKLCGFPTVHPDLWRIIGFVSSLVGLITYAMSPPFSKLFKQENLGVLVIIVAYCAVGSLLCCVMLCTTTWSLAKKTVLTINVVFFVLMTTSVYSFYVDKIQENTKEKEGDKVLNMVSCGAFSFMSLSLSRLTGLGFEAGVFNFFLGAFMVSVMKWNLKFALAAAIFCYILISIRTYSDSEMENMDSDDIEEAGVSLMERGSRWERKSSVFQRTSPLPFELHPPVKYDVFISFRAKDTSDFPEFFACALLKKSLRVYAHPELTGNFVSHTVVEEIGKARVSVIIFSKSYLETPWCLDEVHNIMACRASYARTVIPIFYNIDRTSIQDAFSNFQLIKKVCEDNGVLQLKAKAWSSNLAEAASLQGWELLENRRPYELLQNVADHVFLATASPVQA
ncbi:hypothetical protein VNO78_11769 [Psophocarpus tetragonolobus]|uniref:ADP-ribosyl cyclase/cyclic ADP-ribose hydrolase n=1 Tax=Psophocarpus tetragonolobus TaxID=3891 RepID=A0AAN9SM24_PSOTE